MVALTSYADRSDQTTKYMLQQVVVDWAQQTVAAWRSERVKPPEKKKKNQIIAVSAHRGLPVITLCNAITNTATWILRVMLTYNEGNVMVYTQHPTDPTLHSDTSFQWVKLFGGLSTVTMKVTAHSIKCKTGWFKRRRSISISSRSDE